MFQSRTLGFLAVLALWMGRADASGPPILWFEPGSALLNAPAEAVLDHAAVWQRSAAAERIFIEASADRVGPAAFKSCSVEAQRRRRESGSGPPWHSSRNRYAMVFIETIRPDPK